MVEKPSLLPTPLTIPPGFLALLRRPGVVSRVNHAGNRITKILPELMAMSGEGQK